MKHGKPVSLLYLKVLAVGPGQVGKTTFIKRLTGHMKWDIDTASQDSLPKGSTGQADMQIVHIEYSKRTVAISYNLGKSKWEILEETHLEKHISSLVSLLKVSQDSTLDNMNIMAKSYVLDEKFVPEERQPAYLTSLSDSEDEVDGQEPEVHVQEPEQEPSIDKTDNLKPEETPTADHELKEYTSKHPVPTPSQLLPSKEPTKIEKVLSHFRELRYGSILTNRPLHLNAIINLADIGGQPAFLEMLPSLTTGPALYMVFMKIIEGLKTPYPVRFRCEGTKASTEYKEYMYTSEEVIFTALSSIACFGNSDEEVERYLYTMKKERTTKRTISLALLMGTFADILEEPGEEGEMKREEVRQMEQQLKQELTETEFNRNDLIAFSDSKKGKVLFRINNKSGGETEVTKYKKLLETFMEKQFKTFSIPTPWLMFSICIKILALHEGKQIVSFEDCVKIGRQLNMSKQMVKVALQFFHKYIGLVMFFPGNKNLKNIVICNPQAVFASISEIIFNVYDPEKRTISDSKYTEFIEKGQFSIEDINLDTKQGRDLLPVNTLVNLLVHLNIAAPIPGSNTYFLPAVLQTATAQSLVLDLATASECPEPLCVTFRTGYLPLGFVCALVADLISEGDFELIGKEQGEVIYRNKVVFRFRGIYDIQVISWPKFCEFRVFHSSNVIEEFHSSKACPLIRNTMIKAIDKVISVMRQSSLFRLSKDYQLAFRCPDPKHAVPSVRDLGHEPVAVIDSENPNNPEKIICLKCKKLSLMSPNMGVWFGKVSTQSLL